MPHVPKPVDSRLATLRRVHPQSNGSGSGASSGIGTVIAAPLNIDLVGTIFASDAEIGSLIDQLSLKQSGGKGSHDYMNSAPGSDLAIDR